MDIKKLDRNQFKYFLIVAMVIDHIAWSFFPLLSAPGQIMHVIGRLTAPSMALLIAEGYRYTKDKRKYGIRLGLCAIVSWVAFSLYEYGRFPTLSFGMIYTLFLAFMSILIWDKLKTHKAIKIALVVLLCFLSLFGDWPLSGVLWAFFAYIYRDRPKAKWISYYIIAAADFTVCMLLIDPWYSFVCEAATFLVPLLFIFFYNGAKGSKHPFHKWFFYVFYPLHMILLFLLIKFVITAIA